MIKRFIFTIISILLLTTSIVSPAFAAPTIQQSSGKQIVFMIGDAGNKFISVSIQGSNQNKERKTWSKQDKLGFTMAYTKNWWWIEEFVQISFTLQDSLGKQTQKTCVFDTLAQPANSPRVEIIYYSNKGCVGGDAGSVRDPIKDTVKPVRDAFRTINNYLPENKFDFFMTLMNNELNTTGCVLGVATIVKSGGYAALDGTIRKYTMKTCEKTGSLVYDLFTGH